ARLTPEQRDAAVDDLIALVGGVDGLLQVQAHADAAYFCAATGVSQQAEVEANTLRAYRWQYIVSGAMEPRFQKVLGELTTPAQMARIQSALGPLVAFVGEVGEPALH